MKLQTVFMIFILAVLGYLVYNYYLEMQGSNDDKAKWCEDKGYIVENKINFFFDMSCSNFRDNIKYSYEIKENSNDVGEKYYLKEI